MVKYIRVIIVSVLFLPGSLLQAEISEFVFPEMDQAVIDLWLYEGEDMNEALSLLEGVSEEWGVARKNIMELSIAHLDKKGFIEDQDRRIQIIKRLIAKTRLSKARQEAFVLLSEFKDVRECFTNDDYVLDYLISTYNVYLSVHKIIHDEMMGLYEWREFIWYVDHLKIEVASLEGQLKKSQLDGNDNEMITSLEKLKVCLTTLDESLGDAYRPDFELPCNELYDAIKELFQAYNGLIAM